MLAKKIFKWLALAMMLSTLAACGGGSAGDETSSLLADVGNTNTGSGTSDTNDETTDTIFSISSAQVIPTAGSTIVTVTVFEDNPDAQITDDNGNTFTDISQLVPENDVPLRASVTGDAYFLENGDNFLDVTTDQRGQVSFTVAHPGNGNVLLSVQGRVNYEGGGTNSLFFGGSVVAEVVNNNTEIPADGSSSAQILVSARDAFLAPISGLGIDLSFSPDSQATASSTTAFITDTSGQFRANISNAVEQAVSVIPFAGGGRGNTIKLNFTKAAETTTEVNATLVNQGLIAADGTEAATIIVSARSSDGTALSDLPVTLSFPSDSFAVATPASGTTNDNGQFVTAITNLVTQSTTVTPIVGGVSADPITLNFGTTAQDANSVVTATVITQGAIPANGTTTAKLLVLVRDLNGVAIEGAPVALAFPRDSFAVATQSVGTTDANGQFETEISDSVPESVSITAIANGVTSNAVTIDFIASGGGESPTELDINVSDSNAIANGSDSVQVVIVARDSLGNVVPNVPLKLRGGSATSVMRVSGTNSSGTLAVSGNTGEQGLTVTITNSTAESLTLDAVAVVNGNEITSESQAVIFTEVALPGEEDSIASVSLEALATEQVADGVSTITLSGQALTEAGNAVANATVTFERRGSAVISVDNSGRTYADGRFFATVTNASVESFSVRAVVSGVSSPPVILTFTAQTGSDGTVVTPGQPPSRVNIISTPQSQIADGTSAVTITVAVWDSNNVPMEGVEVRLATVPSSGSSTDVSASTLFDKARETTGASGTATFSVTNTNVGQVTIRATAQGVDSEGNASGSTVSQTTTLDFIEPIQATQLTLVSTPNSAVADGTSPINVDVIARNSSGVTVPNVPVSIILAEETARATPSTGSTDDNGVFTTQVTSNQVGTLTMTAQVQDINLSESLDLQFTSASNNSEDVTKLVISQFSNNEQLANGEDAVTIQVSALDDQGTPVSNVSIELITSADFPVAFSSLRGVTGDDGVFTTTVTSIEVGAVSITAQAPDTTNSLRSETISVTFNASNQDAVPATITLAIENNNQPADEAAQVILVATVLDERGQPVVGAEVDLISDNPALDPEDGATNGLGEWRTTLSSAIATSVTITAVTTGGSSTRQSAPQTVTFIEIALATPPASLVLNTPTTTGAVNEAISLIASAKDTNGAPMENVSVVFEIVSGAGIFQTAASGTTDASGTFTSSISSTNAGLVEVRATAAARAITSNTVSLTFEASSDTQVPVASVTLFADSQTLDSAGNPDGIIISARVKDENNNILVGKSVNFVVDSGDIQPVTRTSNAGTVTYAAGASDGQTDVTGVAYARLTTVGDANNRTITVSASSETANADTLQISVTGTTISIDGRNSIVLDPANPTQNDTVLTISLRDSAGNRIANKALTVNSQQGHSLSATQVVTDSNGQATVTITPDPTKIGTDTITVQKVRESETETALTATHRLTISDENFTLTYNGAVSSTGAIEIAIGSSGSSSSGSSGSGLPCVNTSDPNCDTTTDTSTDSSGTETFTVRWLQGGTPQTGERVTISTTRGSINSLIPSDGILDENGELSFQVSSDSVGEAVITAFADAGPTASITVEFVAVTASSIALQATRPVLNANAAGNTSEQSEIIATVRDVNNNLVKNKTIDFSLTDITGGSLTQSRVVTDSSGQARTTYIAGTSSSAANGVQISATVIEDNVPAQSVFLTVAQRSLFIDIGSGNTLIDEDGRRYETLETVLVTDSNGTPVNNATVILSIYPTFYRTERGWCPNEDVNRNGILDPGEDTMVFNGILDEGEDINGNGILDTEDDNGNGILDVDEDENGNGILDEGEDINGNGVLDVNNEDSNGNGILDTEDQRRFNGRLDPGNVLTLDTLSVVTGEGEGASSGYADFKVIYAVSYAIWVQAEVTARTEVAGSEAISVSDFFTTCSQADADAETCPVASPFIGLGHEGCFF